MLWQSGMLSQMRKDIGDKVRKGEVIATLSNPALIQQRIKSSVTFNAKKATYQRLNSVYQKTPALTNIQTVENAEADYQASKANLAALNNRVSFLNIRAPFSGIITKRMVDKGSMIQNGLNEDNPQAIAEIQEMNPIRLTIPVPESDAVAIKKRNVCSSYFSRVIWKRIRG